MAHSTTTTSSVDHSHPGTIEGEGYHHHVAPASLYWKTFIILMVFLFATVGAAVFDVQEHLIHIRGLNIFIALAIAIVKAGFVVWNFMGVRYSTKLTWIWAAAGFVWLLILFGVTMSDYLARWNSPADIAPPGWERIH